MNSNSTPEIEPLSTKKGQSRLAAVKALYSKEMNESISSAQAAVNDILSCYQDMGDAPKLSQSFLLELVTGVIEHRENLDAVISKHLLSNWSLNRLSMVLQCLLRAATFEMAHHLDTSFKIIINEYTEIAHDFCDEKEVGFVNGILENIAKDLRNP